MERHELALRIGMALAGVMVAIPLHDQARAEDAIAWTKVRWANHAMHALRQQTATSEWNLLQPAPHPTIRLS